MRRAILGRKEIVVADEIYKVVRAPAGGRFRRKRFSVVASDDAAVFYKVRRWVEAPKHLARRGYHLLAFDSLPEAIAFKRRPHAPEALEIWRAEGEGEVKPLPQMLVPLFLDETDELTPWEHDWPAGTVMYKRIKLVERVDEPCPSN